MAIEIVCLTTLAVGARKMSKFGAIVSRLTAIEDMAGMNMLCSDKTGTLTKNKMVIQPEAPTFVPGTRLLFSERHFTPKSGSLCQPGPLPPCCLVSLNFLMLLLSWLRRESVV